LRLSRRGKEPTIAFRTWLAMLGAVAALAAPTLAPAQSGDPELPVRHAASPQAPMAPVADLAAPPTVPPPGAQPPPARLFISPAGEPFRAAPGAPNPFDTWFSRADANHDGRIDRGEFRADAERFFAQLDTDHDGIVDGFEIRAYEHDVVPELAAEAENQAFGDARRVYRGAPEGGRQGRGQTEPAPGPPPEHGHAALLNEPEPVSGADLDVNGRVTGPEWLASTDRRFDMLDDRHDGFLTRESLIAHLPRPAKPKKGRAGHGQGPDGRQSPG
jgi:hypothetical protein